MTRYGLVALVVGCATTAQVFEADYAADRARATCVALARCDQLDDLGFLSSDACTSALTSDYRPCPHPIDGDAALACVGGLETADCAALAASSRTLAACAWVCEQTLHDARSGPD